MPANTIRSTFRGRTWEEARLFSNEHGMVQPPRRICPNTYFLESYSRMPATYAISYYDTILIVYKRESIILNTGGHRTSSTLRRLRQFLPRHLHVDTHPLTTPFWHLTDDSRPGEYQPLIDGMEISCPQQ